MTGNLDVAVARCAADGTACRPAGGYALKDVGTAFEIADVDRDGTPDLVVSSASPPGDADGVRVISLATLPDAVAAGRGKDRGTSAAGKPMFKKSFNGGVAGLVVGDGDGDGVAEVICVVRLAGATRVDVWRLD